MGDSERTAVWMAGLFEMDRIVGVSIFVLIGIASGLAGPGVVVSFLIAGSAALLTSLSAVRLSPFVLEGLKLDGNGLLKRLRFWEFAIGWMLAYDLVVGAAIGSIGFSAYSIRALWGPFWPDIALPAAAAIPMIARVIHAAPQTRPNYSMLLAIFKIAALVIFIAAGAASAPPWGHDYGSFFPRGIVGIFEGASINFFAFAALSTLILATSGLRSPHKTLPIVILSAITGSLLLYWGTALVALALIPWPVIQQIEAPLLAATRTATLNPLPVVGITLAALFATFSVIGTAIAEGKRIVPRLAGTRNLNAPSYSATGTAIAVSLLVIASGGNALLLATLFNFGTLMTYILINASVIVLLLKTSERRGPTTIFAHPVIPASGIVICTALAATLGNTAILAGSLWFVLDSLVYVVLWVEKNGTATKFI